MSSSVFCPFVLAGDPMFCFLCICALKQRCVQSLLHQLAFNLLGFLILGPSIVHPYTGYAAFLTHSKQHKLCQAMQSKWLQSLHWRQLLLFCKCQLHRNLLISRHRHRPTLITTCRKAARARCLLLRSLPSSKASPRTFSPGQTRN